MYPSTVHQDLGQSDAIEIYLRCKSDAVLAWSSCYTQQIHCRCVRMGFEATNPLVEGLSLTPSCPSCLTIMAAVHSDFDPSTCALFTIVNRMLAGDHKSSFWNAIRGGPLSGRLRYLAWRHSIHKPMAAAAKKYENS